MKSLVVLAQRQPNPRATSQSAPESVAEVLAGLGARVRELPLFSEPEAVWAEAPRAVFVDADLRLDYAVVVGRALRRAARAPVLLALHERLVGQLDAHDACDDFVVAPFFPAEVYARLRRAEWQHSAFSSEEHLKLGPLYLDVAAHQVSCHGRPVALTLKEFQLLQLLLQSPGRLFGREEILRRVWGTDYEGGERTVDVHVRRLRAKLAGALPLETVRGAGYKIIA